MRISDWSSDVCSSDLARAEIEIDEFAGALAQAVADIVARNDEILAPIIPAAHDDMGMGMAGVEMIDRDPVELRPKILFHPRHQPAGQWLQILIVRAVLGADDEARSEEHTSELQSLMRISYAVFCVKNKNITYTPKVTY